MAKNKLLLNFKLEFLLFAISSQAKDYRLCWKLNKKLGINLIKEADYEVTLKSSKTASTHSFYTFYDEAIQLRYSVIANRSQVGYLVAERKETDFFLLIDEFQGQIDKKEILQHLKEIDLILLAIEINPNSLKSKKNLLLF